MNEDFKKHMEEMWDDVSRIVENRYVFKRLRELLEPNLGIIANVFFDHYVVNYANAITLPPGAYCYRARIVSNPKDMGTKTSRFDSWTRKRCGYYTES